MTLLKAPPKQPKTTVVQLRLDEEARLTLTKYAEYLECSPSHVAAEALKLVYRKDKDFQTWLSSQHTKTSEPNLENHLERNIHERRIFPTGTEIAACTAASNSVCVRTQRLTDDMAHAPQ